MRARALTEEIERQPIRLADEEALVSPRLLSELLPNGELMRARSLMQCV